MGAGACAAEQESIAVGATICICLAENSIGAGNIFDNKLVYLEARRSEAQSRAHIYRRLLTEIVTLEEKKNARIAMADSRYYICVAMTLAWIVALSLLWCIHFFFIFGSDFNQWLCV